MSDAVVVENVLTGDWYRKLHVMANAEEQLERYRAWVPEIVGPGKINVFKEKGVWHLKAYWTMRSRLDLSTPGGLWPMIAWWVGETRISKAMVEAGELFHACFVMPPAYAFVRSIHPRAEEFVEVEGITLVKAGWVPDGYLAVARGGMQKLNGG